MWAAIGRIAGEILRSLLDWLRAGNAERKAIDADMDREMLKRAGDRIRQRLRAEDGVRGGARRDGGTGGPPDAGPPLGAPQRRVDGDAGHDAP